MLQLERCMAKDAKHHGYGAEGSFIPLVVEIFGVWTPFALSILHSIADHTTTRSGISRKMARRNLNSATTFCMLMDK